MKNLKRLAKKRKASEASEARCFALVADAKKTVRMTCLLLLLPVCGIFITQRSAAQMWSPAYNLIGGVKTGDGINTPVDKLHVHDEQSSAVMVSTSGPTGGGFGVNGELGISKNNFQWSAIGLANSFVLKANSGDMIVGAANPLGNIRFSTGLPDFERMTVLSAGNVGINNTLPTERLSIRGNLLIDDMSGNNTGNIKVPGFGGSACLNIIANSGAEGLVRVGGMLVGTFYDTKPLPDEIRTTANESLTLNSRGTGDMFFQTNDNTKMTILNGGNVGIGTSTPQEPLHLFSNNNPAVFRIQSGGAFGSSKIEFWSDPQGSTNEWRPGSIRSTDQALGTYTGGLAFYVNGTGFANKTNEIEVMRITNGNVGIGNSDPKFPLSFASSWGDKISLWDNTDGTHYGFGVQNHLLQIFTDYNSSDIAFGFGSSGSFTENMRILGNGNVGIGVSNPTNKLDVCGTVRCKELLVQTGWCDYVFDNNYKLMSLSDEEKYIKANHHLPEIPSSADVEKNGVSVGQTEAQLLKKIEELTLHVITLNKENETLKSQVETYQNQINTRLTALEKASK